MAGAPLVPARPTKKLKLEDASQDVCQALVERADAGSQPFSSPERDALIRAVEACAAALWQDAEALPCAAVGARSSWGRDPLADAAPAGEGEVRLSSSGAEELADLERAVVVDAAHVAADRERVHVVDGLRAAVHLAQQRVARGQVVGLRRGIRQHGVDDLRHEPREGLACLFAELLRIVGAEDRVRAKCCD